eukprot:15430331-Alexandrium_andersonii.AAC.1
MALRAAYCRADAAAVAAICCRVQLPSLPPAWLLLLACRPRCRCGRGRCPFRRADIARRGSRFAPA